MTHTITIASELKKRTDLLESKEFKNECAKMAQQLGISAKDWNENKVPLMLLFANQYISVLNNQ